MSFVDTILDKGLKIITLGVLAFIIFGIVLLVPIILSIDWSGLFEYIGTFGLTSGLGMWIFSPSDDELPDPSDPTYHKAKISGTAKNVGAFSRTVSALNPLNWTPVQILFKGF